MNELKNKEIKIGISGKRNIPLDANVRAEIKSKIESILLIEKTKSFTGYAGLAKGADTIFADVVISEFNQDVKIVLPFEVTEYEKDFTDNTDLAEFRKWLNFAGNTDTVTKLIPKTQDERNEAYFQVGKFIADNCDYLIVVWDEQKPLGRGGTAEILGYAKEQNKTVEIIKIIPGRTDEIDNKINSLLKVADDNAVKLKARYEGIWWVSLFFGWLTALCFDATLSFHFSTPGKIMFASAEIAFILTVSFLIKHIKKTNLHSKLLSERLKAEKLRLLLTYYHADMPIAISELTQANDPELASIGLRVNEAINKSYQSKWYKHFSIKNLILGQINYHEKVAYRRIDNKPERLEKLQNVIHGAWFFILISHLVALSFEHFHIDNVPILSEYQYPEEICRFLAIGFPATYAGIEGFLHFKEWGSFKEQSVSMITYLRNQMDQLEKTKLESDKMLTVLSNVSSAMLADNHNWNSLLSKKVAPHPIL